MTTLNHTQDLESCIIHKWPNYITGLRNTRLTYIKRKDFIFKMKLTYSQTDYLYYFAVSEQIN